MMMPIALWSLAQQRKEIAEAKQTARRAQRARSGKGVIQLEKRLDKLTLICMAMWSLLQERAELTEEDLLQKVQDIDLRDGQLDGKLKKKVAKCPKCSRVMAPRHDQCLYCGSRKLSLTAFDGV